MKTCFSEDKKVKKCLRTTVCNVCKYIQNERKKSNESFDFPPESEHTLSA